MSAAAHLAHLAHLTDVRKQVPQGAVEATAPCGAFPCHSAAWLLPRLTIAPIREEGAQNDGHVGGERAGGAYAPWGRLFLAGLEVFDDRANFVLSIPAHRCKWREASDNHRELWARGFRYPKSHGEIDPRTRDVLPHASAGGDRAHRGGVTLTGLRRGFRHRRRRHSLHGLRHHAARFRGAM